MFLATDTEETTRMKCQLVNEELKRIHENTKKGDQQEVKYKVMVEAFLILVSKH